MSWASIPQWLRPGRRRDDEGQAQGDVDSSAIEQTDTARKSTSSEGAAEEEDDEDGDKTPKAGATSMGSDSSVPAFTLNNDLNNDINHDGDNAAEPDDDDDDDVYENMPPPMFPARNSAQRAAAPAVTKPPPLPPPPASNLTSSSGLMPPPSRAMPPPSRPMPSNSSSLMPPPSRLPPPRNTNLAPSSLAPPPSFASQARSRGAPPQQQASRIDGAAARLKNSNNSNSKSKRIILTPGHSPLDWAQKTRNTPALTLANVPRPLRVTPSLLALHNGRAKNPRTGLRRDAWSVYRGRVYNLSPYREFHPGGVGELMRGAGKVEGGRLFDEVHPWVNWEGILGPCLVGVLVPEGEGDGVDVVDDGEEADEGLEGLD